MKEQWYRSRLLPGPFRGEEPGTTKLYWPTRLRGKGGKKERDRERERERERKRKRERERKRKRKRKRESESEKGRVACNVICH